MGMFTEMRVSGIEERIKWLRFDFQFIDFEKSLKCFDGFIYAQLFPQARFEKYVELRLFAVGLDDMIQFFQSNEVE